MKKLTLLLFFLAALSFSHAQSQDSSNDSNSDGSNCELVGKLMLPVAKRRKEDLVSFLNIR